MDGWMSKEEEEEKSFVLIDFWFESWWRLGESIPFGWITRDLSNQVWFFNLFVNRRRCHLSSLQTDTHTHREKCFFLLAGRKFDFSYRLRSPPSLPRSSSTLFLGSFYSPSSGWSVLRSFIKKGKIVSPFPIVGVGRRWWRWGWCGQCQSKREGKRKTILWPPLKSNNESMTLGLVRHRTN